MSYILLNVFIIILSFTLSHANELSISYGETLRSCRRSRGNPYCVPPCPRTRPYCTSKYWSRDVKLIRELQQTKRLRLRAQDKLGSNEQLKIMTQLAPVGEATMSRAYSKLTCRTPPHLSMLYARICSNMF